MGGSPLRLLRKENSGGCISESDLEKRGGGWRKGGSTRHKVSHAPVAGRGT